MQEKHTTALYTIGITANLIKICPATLRIWEKKGLIKPTRLGKNRFYSRCGDCCEIAQFPDVEYFYFSSLI